MAFKASKTRGRRTQPVAKGTQLIANAGIADAYAKSIKELIDAMMKDYRSELSAGEKHPDVEELYSGDASPTSFFKRILGRLDKKWRGVFTSFAKRHAEAFTKQVNNYSAFSTNHSLKQLGLDNPKDATTQRMSESIAAAIQENVALITNIQESYAKDIEGYVFRSIASPNPTENGIDQLMGNLMDTGDMSKRRAQLIAQDQNLKLYSALNKERMESNGVEKFQWKHSSAGKYPRHTHMEREKEDVGYGPGIFRFDSPELWEGPESDRGLPGQAIRCRCRMIPVIDLS